MNQQLSTIQTRRTCHGGIFLFIAFLLPILFFSIIIIVEITTISFSTNALQTNLDSVVISAAQRLPDVESARRTFSEAFENSSVHPVASISPDTIEATASSPNQSFLLSYFGIEQSIVTAAHVKAIIPPLTVAVAMDTSSYTAPGSAEPAWSSTNLLPAALFQQDSQQPRADRAPSPLHQTQGCFNSLLLPLKRFVVETIASLEEVPSYRLAAATFPASTVGKDENAGLSEIKRLSDPTPLWVSYESLHRSNSTCAAVALHDTLYHLDSPYRFPRKSRHSHGGISDSGERIVDIERREFNLNYAPFLSVEEIIWSQAAREADGGSTVAALESLGRFVISEHRSMALPMPTRGKPAVVGLLFAGDVPRSSSDRFPGQATVQALQKAVSTIARLATESGVNLYLPYILFENNTGVTLEEGQSLSTMLSTMTALTPHVRIPVLMTKDAASLEQKLLPLLKNLRKPVIISE